MPASPPPPPAPLLLHSPSASSWMPPPTVDLGPPASGVGCQTLGAGHPPPLPLCPFAPLPLCPFALLLAARCHVRAWTFDVRDSALGVGCSASKPSPPPPCLPRHSPPTGGPRRAPRLPISPAPPLSYPAAGVPGRVAPKIRVTEALVVAPQNMLPSHDLLLSITSQGPTQLLVRSRRCWASLSRVPADAHRAPASALDSWI